MGTGFRRGKSGNKNIPYLSHEFVIQNHGDIVTCLMMVFTVGLMFQITTPLSSVFIMPSHYITADSDLLNYGAQDITLVFFYTLAAIVFHAVIQEYVLDKWVRKTRLSKTNTSKFSESGQLLAFSILSLVWLLNIFKDESYFSSLKFFSDNYPHNGMTTWTKMFFIIQISYWVHVLPELYFQKVKKEEISAIVTPAIFNLIATIGIYVLSLQRIGLTILFIEYLIRIIFHTSRLLNFFGKNKYSKIGFNVYMFVLIGGKLLVSVLSIFIFWFELAKKSVDVIDFEARNFNTALTRTTVLVVILSTQLLQIWESLAKFRKSSSDKSTTKKAPVVKKVAKKGASSGSEAEELNSDEQQTDASAPPSPAVTKVKSN